MNDGVNMKFSIDQWDKISECFVNMFQGLGKVESSPEILQFSSIAPSVPTGISLSKEGKMAASMPLHNLDSTFHHVNFGNQLEALTLIGEGFHYTYRIPSEILSMRSN